MTDDPSLDEALERLTRLHPKRIDLSLGRMERLLAALGHPERRMPPAIHVGGTNGKGSTVAFLRAILEARGLAVHVYTSPHLVRFNERIRLSGKLIETGRLVEALTRVEAANGEAPITFFEVTTAAAFVAFAEASADVLLLEVGLGGRLDATRPAENVIATAITRLSMDHMAFLGDTIEMIAAEKAGIARAGVPLVLAPQPNPAAARTVVETAMAVGAPVLVGGRDWTVGAVPDGFVVVEQGTHRQWPAPALTGDHQFENAATAIVTAGLLPKRLRPDAAQIRAGLARVEWPARLQRLAKGPLVEVLPLGWQLWLDGGHNDSAGEALGRWIDERARTIPVHVVVGMIDSKIPSDFLLPVMRGAATLTTVDVAGEQAGIPAGRLAEIARGLGRTDAMPAKDVAEALSNLAGQSAGKALVLICGSLYLAGSVLKGNG